jgi:UDP-N-acetyl-2-amino-2-deoxyglucuronate dehydrogenase
MKKFAIIGVGGYIAPRHLKAIKETGNVVVAALDKNDSVGILDSYFPDADFFTEFERFDRHIEKLRQEKQQKIDYVSICSPNYLHDAHIRFALRVGADVICEKPVTLNPWNLDALEKIEKETGCKINPILQLRLHDSMINLKKKVDNSPLDKIFNVDVTYVPSRGKWYDISWKGDIQKSGGIATNIGVHFFDMLIWIFGEVKENIIHTREDRVVSGELILERANVKWFLSIDKKYLPLGFKDFIYKSIKVEGEEIEFSKGFENLHTKSYEKILEGGYIGLKDIKSSIKLISDIRTQKLINNHDIKEI